MPDPIINHDLTAVSAQEHLRILRKSNGWTQVRAAAFFGLSRFVYGAMEQGHAPITIRPGPLGRVTETEKLILARWRTRLTVEQLCAQLGVSKVTLFHWERVAAATLVAYYEKNGFTGFTTAGDGTNTPVPNHHNMEQNNGREGEEIRQGMGRVRRDPRPR